MNMKRLIILTLITATCITSAQSINIKDTLVAMFQKKEPDTKFKIRTALQDMATNNESFTSLQKIYDDSNTLASKSAIHKVISGGLSIFGTWLGSEVLYCLAKYYFLSDTSLDNDEEDSLIANNIGTIIAVVLGILSFGGSYLTYKLGQTYVTRNIFKKKLTHLIEHNDIQGSEALNNFLQTHTKKWLKTKQSSDKKGKAYITMLSKEILKVINTKKYSFWNSCVGTLTKIELTILATILAGLILVKFEIISKNYDFTL